MDLIEYQKLSRKTVVYPQESDRIDILHAACEFQAIAGAMVEAIEHRSRNERRRRDGPAHQALLAASAVAIAKSLDRSAYHVTPTSRQPYTERSVLSWTMSLGEPAKKLVRDGIAEDKVDHLFACVRRVVAELPHPCDPAAVYDAVWERSHVALPPNMAGKLYPVLGLMGELDEWLQDPRDAAEAGDVLWYVAQLCTEFSLPLQMFNPRPPASAATDNAIRRQALMVPKTVLKWATADSVAAAAALVGGLHIVLGILLGAIAQRGFNLNELADANLAKLGDRAARNVLHGSGSAR